MIASSGYAFYWAGREVFRFIHPWWARVLLVAAGVGVIAGIAFIQTVMDERKKDRERQARQRSIDQLAKAYVNAYGCDLAEANRRAHSDVRLAMASLRTGTWQRTRRRPAEDGTCAHWIPKGFEAERVYQ